MTAIVALAAVNYVGVTRTVAATKVIVVLVLLVLATVVAAGVLGGEPTSANLLGDMTAHGWYGIVQSAGLMFFAFAGYARIATLGEEVKDPARTIPRAIVIALGAALAVYAVIAVTALAVLGSDDLARSTTPLVDVATAGGDQWPATVVRVGAGAAALGALLALIAGVGRTGLAMARTGDLPRPLAAVHPRYRVPHRAEIAVAVVAGVLVLTADLRDAIGFSSFGVLLYYFVANVAASTQQGSNRRYPRVLAALGAFGCVALVLTLPRSAIVTGVIVVVIGVGYRLLVRRIGPAAVRGSRP